MQDIVKEAEEGGQVEGKAKVLFSAKVQLFSTFFAMATGSVYWVCWFLGLGLINVEDTSRMVEGLLNQMHDSHLSIFMVVVPLSVFLDSICNDICAHYIAFSVDDKTLRAAKQVRIERASRAAHGPRARWQGRHAHL